MKRLDILTLVFISEAFSLSAGLADDSGGTENHERENLSRTFWGRQS